MENKKPNFSRRFKLYFVGSLAVAVVFIMGCLERPSPFEDWFGITNEQAFWGSIIPVFAWALGAWIWMRCHACKKYIGRAVYPSHCYHCGEQLIP